MVFLSSITSFALAEEHGTVTFELYLKKLGAADFLLLAKIEWYSIGLYAARYTGLQEEREHDVIISST